MEEDLIYTSVCAKIILVAVARRLWQEYSQLYNTEFLNTKWQQRVLYQL